MEKGVELEQGVYNLHLTIKAEIHHGECFYELDMLEKLCSDLDKLKVAAREYYDYNKKGMVYGVTKLYK